MAISLNLLPQDQIITGTFARFLKVARSMGIIFLILFIFFTLGSVAFIIINTSKNKTLEENIEKLKSDIVLYESSEAQIVLLKDRIAKIQVLDNLSDALSNLNSIDSLTSELPETSSLTDLSVDSKKIDLVINFRSNSDLNLFMRNLSKADLYDSIILTSFVLNPKTGYLVGLSISKG